jgi:hypothetical protein
MIPPTKGSGAFNQDRNLIEIETAAVLSYIDGRRARDQNAGGGRMNWVAAGRKVSDTSATKIASGAVNRTGADAVVAVLIPA